MQLEWIDLDKPKLFTKRRILFLAVIALCLLIFGALCLVRAVMTKDLVDTRAAERFAPDGGYAQVSCYFTKDANIAAGRYREFIYRIKTALTLAAIEQDEDAPEDAQLFLTCYSTEARLKLTRGSKTADADAIGTAGDFFTLHPVELVTGMYYMPDAVMKDQVLLNEILAWQLFGGTDIAGQEVMIGGMPHLVSGVVKDAEGRFRKAAGCAGPLVYLSAESPGFLASPLAAPSTGTGGSSAGAQGGSVASAAGSAIGSNAVAQVQTSGNRTMDCFEVVMPNPVRGFAASILRSELKIDEHLIRIVDQNVRFGNLALWKVLTEFGTRSMAGAAMRFPYWENVARGVEDVLVIVLILQALFLLIPVVMVTVAIVQAYRHKKWTAKDIYDRISDRIYEYQAKKRSRRVHT